LSPDLNLLLGATDSSGGGLPLDDEVDDGAPAGDGSLEILPLLLLICVVTLGLVLTLFAVGVGWLLLLMMLVVVAGSLLVWFVEMVSVWLLLLLLLWMAGGVLFLFTLLYRSILDSSLSSGFAVSATVDVVVVAADVAAVDTGERSLKRMGSYGLE
jgi:hypothetical protein